MNKEEQENKLQVAEATINSQLAQIKAQEILIDRLQKENEELKDYKERTEHTIMLAKATQKENELLREQKEIMENVTIKELFDKTMTIKKAKIVNANDFISKDKIKDKIKELEKCCLVLQDYKSCKGCESINCDMKIKYEVLEELLEK